jgi:ATP-dependent DNA helicase DinG
MAARAVRLGFDAGAGKLLRSDALARREFLDALDRLIEETSTLADEIEAQRDRSEELPALHKRATAAADRLSAWRDSRGDLIRWADVTTSGWQLHATPLSVAEIFRKETESSARSWVFTSATLSVAGDFSLFARQLGLEAARSQSWASPFDYASAGRIYVPRNLPPPNSPQHTSAVIDEALELVTLSGGRAFAVHQPARAAAVCGSAATPVARARSGFPGADPE